VLCGKTALENEVTAKCIKKGQKGKKEEKKKGWQGEKKDEEWEKLEETEG